MFLSIIYWEERTKNNRDRNPCRMQNIGTNVSINFTANGIEGKSIAFPPVRGFFCVVCPDKILCLFERIVI